MYMRTLIAVIALCATQSAFADDETKQVLPPLECGVSIVADGDGEAIQYICGSLTLRSAGTADFVRHVTDGRSRAHCYEIEAVQTQNAKTIAAEDRRWQCHLTHPSRATVGLKPD